MLPKTAMFVTTATLCFLFSQVTFTVGFLLQSCLGPDGCQCDQNYLHCERRGLTSVPTAPDTNSEIYFALLLNGNKISVISKYSFQNYRVNKIDLSHNTITTFDPEAFLGLEIYLQELNLEDTHLTRIPQSVTGLSRLRKLNIRDNPGLRILPPAITAGIGQSLLSLSFAKTGIRYWPSALSSLTKLEWLDMSHNMVSYISSGATDAIANSLKELILVNSSFSTFQAPLSQLKALQILDLSQNAISSIPKGSFLNFAHSLREFKLTEGKLTYLPDALEELKVLEELDLSNNPMVSTNADLLDTGSNQLLTNSRSTLSTLSLANCSLLAVPSAVNGLDNLVSLDLSGNKIVDLHGNEFYTLGKLSYLNLKNNPIQTIPYRSLAGLNSLSSLNLSGCRLKYVPSSSLTSLPSLATLDLSYNQINDLLDYTFPNPSKLSTVDLSGNVLKNISYKAFNDAHSIMTLKMNSCSLTALPTSLAQANGLRAVYVEDNAIDCTCDRLSWVSQWRTRVGIIPRFYGSCNNDNSIAIDTYVSDSNLSQCSAPVIG